MSNTRLRPCYYMQKKETSMTPTDNQLKQALAKMLLEQIVYEDNFLYWKRWPRKELGQHSSRKILDTELLHLCWLVEETMGCAVHQYHTELIKTMPNGAGVHVMSFHATWQQRVIALAKVKGVEIV